MPRHISPLWSKMPIINNNNDMDIYIAPVSARLSLTLMALYSYYPGRSRAVKVTSAQAFHVPIYTWVESGKCRLTSCKRTLVPWRDLNPIPCDLQHPYYGLNTTDYQLLNCLEMFWLYIYHEEQSICREQLISSM